jgi:hypothetical protein
MPNVAVNLCSMMIDERVQSLRSREWPFREDGNGIDDVRLGRSIRQANGVAELSRHATDHVA